MSLTRSIQIFSQNFTVDRVLRDRISLTLEKNRIPVAHNYPYLLPEGSTEVRHLVWHVFPWLQQRFEDAYPETIGDPAYGRVWEMLQDTNLRSAQAGELRSVLHMHRRLPLETTGLYEYIIDAYRNIHSFVESGQQKSLLNIGTVRKDVCRWELKSVRISFGNLTKMECP